VAAASHGSPSSTTATTAGLAVAVPVAAYFAVTGVLQGRLGPHWAGRLPMVGGACLLVLVIGGLAGELGVGVATLLIGLVVAGLVTLDELQRDAQEGHGRASA